METKWLKWAQKLQAIAQNGLTYSEGIFDIERYKQLRA
ncbi:MAG: NUDIX hydrolase N-terminal domain-containing protein [Nostoc sp.]